MTAIRGYYSLIQYCPDRSRLEAANVGVVLFVPDRSFFKARISPNNEHVRRFFRPTKLIEPLEELNSLFEDLVDHRAQVHEHRPIIHQLEEAFRSSNIASRITFNKTVQVPVVNRPLRVPYAYQNGKLNLIAASVFRPEGDPIAKGALLATEGRLLRKATEPMQLIIVPELDFKGDKKAQFRRELRGLFDDANIRAVWENQREDFIAEVEREAH